MPVDPNLLIGFLAVSAVLSAIPGPSVIVSTSKAITRGRRSAMPIVFGNVTASAFLAVAVALGLGTVLYASAQVFAVIKVLGAVYLAYLGVRAILHARGIWIRSEVPDDTGETDKQSFGQGLLIGVSNPKSFVGLIAILPQFVSQSLPNPALQMVVIGLCGAAMQLLIESVWVAAASALRGYLMSRPRRLATLHGLGGLSMIGIGARLAVDRTQPH